MNFNKTLSAAALALFIISGTAVAQVKKKPVTHPAANSSVASTADKPLPTDPSVIIGKLPNGLTYYIRYNPEPQKRAVLYLVNKAGSVLENDNQQGLAHFTEHMAFKGTKDFPKNQLIDYLQKSGVKFGADVNASTGYDQTVYELPLPTDSVSVFEKGFNILANWAAYVTFDPAEMDSERGVILEEARLRGKNAGERLRNQVNPLILNNSRYVTRVPIGKEDIIKTATVATIKSFYHDWYRPDLQAVIAVGDFNPTRVLELIKQNFSSLQNPAPERPRTTYSVAPSIGTGVVIATDKEFPYTVARIYVKHPEVKANTYNTYLHSIRIALFNAMLNDRLNEISQKSNPPFMGASSTYGGFIGHEDVFVTSVQSKSDSDLQGAIKAAVAENERVRKFGFTLTELERAKQNALVAMQNAFKERYKTESINYVQEYEQNFLNGDAIPGIDFEYNFYLDNISKITLPEVNALAGKFMSDQNRTIVLEAPESEKTKLPDEKTLLSWVNSVTVTQHWIDNVSNEPLLTVKPRASAVVRTMYDDSISTATVILSNGVKIILKPTDFKNDQILISGYSFGGTSLASDADFTSANLAGSIVSNSGVSDFTQVQLDKLLAGKNLSISPYISETTQGVSGYASPQDLETALQLLYLYFTKPRIDPIIWQTNITQSKAYLATRLLAPGNVFADTVSAVLSNHNFRSLTPTAAMLDAASIDKAFAFYKDRFADASGFTFTLVGNFDVRDILPKLQVYLGGLPSTQSNQNYKDLHIYPPAGQITKIVHKGIGDKATVELVFSGDYVYNPKNNVQLDALEGILQIKLTDRLRQQESGVYSPGVKADYVKIPDGRYSFTVYFGCAPANVDKLIASALDEINKIKQDGAQASEIEKFTSEDLNSSTQQLRQNIFWAGYLAGGAQNQEDPHRILNHPKDLQSVTPQSTKDAANKYLSGSNLIKFELLPEKAPDAVTPPTTAPTGKQ
jgi:zinc protease